MRNHRKGQRTFAGIPFSDGILNPDIACALFSNHLVNTFRQLGALGQRRAAWFHSWGWAIEFNDWGYSNYDVKHRKRTVKCFTNVTAIHIIPPQNVVQSTTWQWRYFLFSFIEIMEFPLGIPQQLALLDLFILNGCNYLITDRVGR